MVIKKKKIDETKENTEVEKIIQFTGKIPVDQEAVDQLGSIYHVYIHNDKPFDCMLNQTNLTQNNNKYYLLQLLEHNNKQVYIVWFRWGRVGKNGQTTYHNCGNDLNKAIYLFASKFNDKTKNDWNELDNFEKVPGKYDIVQKDYSLDEKEDEKLKQALIESKKPIPKSKLDESIQRLIEFVCNIQEMENFVREMKYDAKKAPLGKLSVNQIKAGYQALKKIEEFINEGKFKKEFYEACSQFYTRIPHDFGMRMPTPINTVQLLKEKLSLLEALGDIEVALKMLNKTSNIENPIDRHYEQLDCEIKILDKSDKMFKIIEDYIQKTHAPTHCNYKMIIHDIFEVNKKQEQNRFKDLGNRMLLWHGSRSTNWAGILSTGIRIAPPEAPVTGYMFGKGCYFADSSSKSANYCYSSKNKNIGLISLSEVSLGTPNNLINADYEADKLPSGKDSTKGLGKYEPNKNEWITLDDGCVIPCGKLVPVKNTQGYTLMYNEYIVYDTNQIKLRYLCKIEFEFI